jgi:hypothetical protein
MRNPGPSGVDTTIGGAAGRSGPTEAASKSAFTRLTGALRSISMKSRIFPVVRFTNTATPSIGCA